MKVLVTGATGAVGPQIVKALLTDGYFVRTFSIDKPQLKEWSGDVEVITGDITDFAAVQTAMQDVDAVIHLAALLHIVNPTPSMQRKYESINVGGTDAVVRAAIQERVKRIVLFSTITVYGVSNRGIITESTPPNPDTFYAQTKLAAENIVMEAKGTDGRQIGTILRFGAIYGSRIKGNYRRLLKSLAKGYFIPFGSGSNRRTLIYVKDVAQAAIVALKHTNAAGRIFNVSDGEYHTLNHIIETICYALDRKPPRFSLPVGPMRFVVGAVEKISGLFGYSPPITRATIDKYIEDIAVDGSLFQKQLGFVPQYDLLSGWKDAVQEMKRSGDL